MGYKNLPIGALAILLVAWISISAFAPEAGRSHGFMSTGSPGLAQGMSSWQQVNSNGFGDLKEQEVSALEAFNSYLYAGTHNVIDPLAIFDGARIFRSPDGVTWTPVTQPGFQNPHDTAAPAILDFVVFGNRLYASTGGGGNQAQIWRTFDGLNWGPMVAAGFGDPEIHDIAALAVYNGVIYAGASSQVSGARIFRSSSGDSNTWTLVPPAAPTMDGASVTGFAVFNGALYATIESEAPVQIWRSSGGAWTAVMNNGFGNSLTTSTGGMAVFGGHLYVGAGNSAVGAQLWRSNNGTSWAQVINPGFADSNNQKVETVFVFQNQLYVSVKNAVTGMEVWRSAEGTLWEQVNQDGFGDSNNATTNGSHATAEFLSQLYVGTSNIMDGGELWRMLQQLNNPPTNITLSNSSIDENLPAATLVGTFSTTDDSPGPFTYSFCGGVDDGSFLISGMTLQTMAVFDYETKSSYSICVRSTDSTAQSFDKTFTISVNNAIDAATFQDVPTTYWAWQYIESIYAARITSGCHTSPLNYCPTTSVSRDQMAVFLLRGIHGGSYTPPPATGTVFNDVPASYWAAAWIEQLASEGITSGCGNNNYCPTAPVTRAQMAVFLLRSRYGSSYNPPAVGGSTGFADVHPTYWAGAWIKQLVAEGITAGCGTGIYCPDSLVTRAQMAVFLVKTFNLP